MEVIRSNKNPILKPEAQNPWEAAGAFNGCVAFDGKIYHMVYRALSHDQNIGGHVLQLSTVGYAQSSDGINFKNHQQLFEPTEAWEKFGCEDPRITFIDGNFYIFYTALSNFPFNADCIKVAVAVTRDFKNFEKHQVTPFNAKACALFPEKINGKFYTILSVHTDQPPARVALASAEKVEDFFSREFWLKWYADLDAHILFVRRTGHDHVEVGAPPVKTKAGWLLVFSYIKDYFAPPPTFGIEAILMDLNDPMHVIGRTIEPVLQPEEEYERVGNVADITFPTGALVKGQNLQIYYGAADTTTCLASVELEPLLNDMHHNGPPTVRLRRSSHNPILSPIANHAWESKAVFNPAAWYDGQKVHLLYRAQGEDNTSVFGYAASYDGLSLAERYPEPVYVPTQSFEQKLVPGGNSGCEDPRLTQIGDRLYMCYTAYDGQNPPRVALTSILVEDFKHKRWNWETPKLISPPNEDDKDAALFPGKINNQYVFLHRLGKGISIDKTPDLNFGQGKWLRGPHILNPRDENWDSVRIGIAGPPMLTKAGWLLLYHGISHHTKYRLGAALLDLKDPSKILARTDEPILEPEMTYEKFGQVPQVVFPCGAVIIGEKLFVYYGGADSVVGAAYVKLSEILG